MNGAPDFSPFASDYRRGRPRYPAALYDWLASQVDRHDLAWDTGTGNGQAAVDLAGRFAHVLATDISAEQLRHAAAHPRVEYRLAHAEASGLPDASVDLAVAAAAVHWFDPVGFAAEIRRVLRPGGVLAVWTYHPARVDPPFDGPLGHLYWDLTKPWFAPQTALVDAAYETLDLPGEPLAAPPFDLAVDWDMEQLIAFLRSFSGVQAYEKERGEDPVEQIVPALQRLWEGAPEERRHLRWPLALRATRLGAAAAE